MATLLTPDVVAGSTARWDIPLSADLVALNAEIAALTAGLAALTFATPTPWGSAVNVADYGAVGNGTTDDTAAIVAARNVVFASVNPQGHCTKELVFPAGKFRVTAPGTLMSTPNAAGGAQTQVKSFTIRGAGKRKSQIFYDYSGAAGVGRHTADNALFIAGNRVNQLRVHDIGFLSTNAGNTCFFFWSRTGNGSGTGGVFPEYGSGNNQDTVFTDVEFSGTWRWCVLLDGDITCNLNSEFFCERLAITSNSVFAEAFWQVGYTSFASFDQQDQMVNYSFTDCKFEYKSGDCFRFNRGGVVNFRGGSYINGVGDDVAKTGGCFFKVANVTIHNAGCQNASFTGIRFELRNENCKIMDVAGWYGAAAHISLTDCNDTGHSFATPGPLTASCTFRTHNGSFPQVRATNCALGGFWQVLGTQTSYGRLVFLQCGFYTWKGGAGSTASANTFVRYDGATVPKYRYQDCPELADAAN